MAERMNIKGTVFNTSNSITDSEGYAIPPLATNLGVGQIAVHTSETDPCIFFKTSAGKMVKIVSEEKLTKALTDILGNSAADLDTLRELIAQFEGSANDILPMLVTLTDRVTAAETALGNKANSSTVNAHISNTSNPHGVTAAQVGALAVNGTAVDSDKLGGLDAGYYARQDKFSQVKDLNTIFGESNGFYTIDGNLSNTPIASPNMRVINIGVPSRATQMAFDWVSDRAFFRRKQDSHISNWSEFYHSGNSNTNTNDWRARQFFTGMATLGTTALGFNRDVNNGGILNGNFGAVQLTHLKETNQLRLEFFNGVDAEVNNGIVFSQNGFINSNGLNTFGEVQSTGKNFFHRQQNYEPQYSITIGDNDTGFNWVQDGYLKAFANGVEVFGFTGSEFDMMRQFNLKHPIMLLGSYGEIGNTNAALGETTLSREIQNVGYRDINQFHINSKIAFENYNNFGAGALSQGGRIAFYAADKIYKEGDPTVLVAKIDTHTGLTVEKNVVAKGDIVAQSPRAVVFAASDQSVASATRLNDLQDVKLPDNLAGKMVLAYDPAQVNADGSTGGYTFMPAVGVGTGKVVADDVESLPDMNVNGGMYPYPSDRRLNENVVSLQNVDKVLLSLHPKSFTWNENGRKLGLKDEVTYGLIAQDVAEVLPHIVMPIKDGYIGVDYIKLIPYLLDGYKLQHKEITTLNSTLSSIKTRANKAYELEDANAKKIAQLEAELTELKQLIGK